MDDLIDRRCTQCSRYFKVHVVDALDTGTGHEGDRKPHGKSNQEYVRSVCRRKRGQCQRDPGGRRDRPNDLCDRIEPVSHDLKVTQREAGQKTDRCAPEKSGDQKF